MTDLRELYQEVILDHNKRPQNFRKLEDANRTAEGYNPLCGDQITVYVRVEDHVIKEIAFQGSGCAISKASASMMTGIVKGKTTAEAESLFGTFHRMVTADPEAASDLLAVGKLAAFAGVREFPVRVKCATLPWHTLHAALEGRAQVASTE
ncbi:MAG: SUF system NifU family Fe-S cluster assembly protein [candidate division NC10 bacterium]|nr:SUF system NifU family Fe-S cluster assembly protein [candidate division NC10 bacterium]MDE2322559.1 SUF system NifU family Fe-S cluster assembly protein [candidate division NC10 bacterium]